MKEKISAPMLMVLGVSVVVGAVWLVTTKAVKVSVSKPETQAAAVCVLISPGQVRYDLNKDKCFNNNDVKIVADAIINKTYLASADFDGNNKIDTNDLGQIRNALWQFLYATYSNSNDPRFFSAYYDLNLDGAFNNKDVKFVADAVTAQKSGTFTPMADVDDRQETIGGIVVNKIDTNDLGQIRNALWQVNKSYFLDLDISGKVNDKDVQMVKSKLNTADMWADLSNDGMVNKTDYRMIGDYTFDITGDGKVDNADVDLISYVARKLKPCPAGKNCDLNGDGGVYLDDATLILNYIKTIATL